MGDAFLGQLDHLSPPPQSSWEIDDANDLHWFLHLGVASRPAVPTGLGGVQSVVGDLVDRRGVGLGRMMTDTKGSKSQERLALSQLDTKDHAEFAIRGRESQLHAMPKGGAFRTLLFASEETRYRHSLCLELSTGRTRHFFPRSARPSQVLSEGSIIE
jgi:hypothetical protein